MKRIMLLSLLFGLNSCLLLWNEATEKKMTSSESSKALALAVMSGVACTAPTESVFIENIMPQQGDLLFQISGTVPSATHYLFFRKTLQATNWILFYTISAADFDSNEGTIPTPNPGLDDYMIRAASNGCIGPDSNTFSPQG